MKRVDLLDIHCSPPSDLCPGRSAASETKTVELLQVGPDGQALDIGKLLTLQPPRTYVEWHRPPHWPLDADMADSGFEGLPYFLQDLRPQGFLGRLFARQRAAEGKADGDPDLWSDDLVVALLADGTLDVPGDLLMGSASRLSRQEHLRTFKSGRFAVELSDRTVIDHYVLLAEQVLSGALRPSLLGGEFPKFTALRQRPDGTAQHVLVKFSGADASAGAQRWADLLICEHLAAEVVRDTLGLEASRSRILQGGGRTFLEVDRFDRHGALGRSPVVSWFALNAAVLGQLGQPWPDALTALLPMKWLTRDTVEQVQRLWWFGQLIGNTDMHDGNLSFIPGRNASSAPLQLAPVYDMLPMAYAPVRGVELPPWRYQPRLPLPAQAPAWTAAAQAAGVFWERAANDLRISPAFRAHCADNLKLLRTVAASMGV